VTRRHRQTQQVRVVLDSGALSALLGRSQRARGWLRWVVEQGGTVVVPAPVLVECTTGNGARDAEINRVLRILVEVAAAVRPAGEATARRAGALRHRAGSDDGIDALLAAEAVGEGGATVLLTSDPADLQRLLMDAPQVAVRAV
jgi:predicted nucleic acid-binding protein